MVFQTHAGAFKTASTTGKASPNISLNNPRKPPSIGFYKDYQI
jgi:hypothetical protein